MTDNGSAVASPGSGRGAIRLSLKATLVALFGGVAIISAGQGIVAYLEMTSIRRDVNEVARKLLPSVAIVNEMSRASSQVRLRQYRIVTTSIDNETFAANRDLYKKAVDEMADARKRYEPLISSAEERDLYDRFAQSWAGYEAGSARLLSLMEAGHRQEAMSELVGPGLLKLFSEANEVLSADVELNRHAAQRDADATVANADAGSLIAVIAVALASLAAFVAMLFGVRRISRPITGITAMMGALAAGDTGASVPFRGRRDEIGAMAAAVQVFKDNLIRTRALEHETAVASASADERRRAVIREMADEFEVAVGGVVGMVSSSATELQATAQQMTATATETASQSTTVAAAAEEASCNVATVAAAAEELGSSVQEIGRQVVGSAQLAQAAVGDADQTGMLVQELSAAVSRIGDVVTMISGIASQTNLLALNATIEAARAGEAGRGFAVVAAEVKQLASQTAKATEEISGQIERIQATTEQAVSAIRAITARISEMNTLATAIAAAVEEQGAATQEIVRNVAQAAAGTGDVTSNISGVAEASEQTGAAAMQVLGAASEMSRQSEQLAAEVGRFLATIRAA